MLWQIIARPTAKTTIRSLTRKNVLWLFKKFTAEGLLSIRYNRICSLNEHNAVGCHMQATGVVLWREQIVVRRYIAAVGKVNTAREVGNAAVGCGNNSAGAHSEHKLRSFCADYLAVRLNVYQSKSGRRLVYRSTALRPGRELFVDVLFKLGYHLVVDVRKRDSRVVLSPRRRYRKHGCCGIYRRS